MIDQTWIASWGARASSEELLRSARWVCSQKESIRDLAFRFPPYCVVRRKDEVGGLALSVLLLDEASLFYPTTCGIVTSYQEGRVLVLQQPDAREGVWVRVEELEVVKPFGCLSKDYLKAIYHTEHSRTLTERVIDGVKKGFHVRTKGGPRTP